MRDQDKRILIHYGVKGMKWGTRRAMGKRSREASRVGLLKSTSERVLDKREEKVAKASRMGRDTTRLRQRVKEGRALVDLYSARYDKLTTGLSAKDLRQGRRGAAARTLVAGLLAGPIGVFAVEGILTGKANARALDGK